MPQTPISVIIPTYNRAGLLPTSLQSFLKTDYENAEFIILDNGSADNTSDIVYKLISSDNRFRYVKNTKNLGLARSIFRGVLEAYHDRIVFFSDEDYIDPSLISKIASVYDVNPDLGSVTIGEIDQKSYQIPNFTKKCQKSSDRSGFTLHPGAYSAYISYIKTAYIGCAALNRKHINFNYIPLDNVSYPQRWLSSISAFYGGIHVFTEEGLGEFPKFNAKAKGGTGSQRWGDYALSEYMDNAEFILNLHKPDEILDKNDFNLLQAYMYKFIYTKFPSYFRNIVNSGNLEKAYEFFKAVIDQNAFSRSYDFWRFVNIFFDVHFDSNLKKAFTDCNRRYMSEIKKGDVEKVKSGFTTFGVKRNDGVFKQELLETTGA